MSKAWQSLQTMAFGLVRSTPDAPGFSDLLEHQAMVGDGVAVLKARGRSRDFGGALLAGFWFRGPDIESASSAELDALSRRVNDGFKLLSAGCMVHVEAIRIAAHVYERGWFAEAVDQLIDDERYARAGSFFTEYALFVTQAPTLLDRSGASRSVRHVFFGKDGQAEVEALDARVARFERLMTDFEHALGTVLTLRRMRQRPNNDELLQALQVVINGSWKMCPSPRSSLYLDSLLAHDLRWSSSEMSHAGDFVSVVTFADLPAFSTPAMMEALTTLPFEVRWSSRFIVMDYGRARDELVGMRRKWNDKQTPFLSRVFNTPAPADRDAVERTDEVEEALADLESNVVRYGHYTSCVIVRAHSRQAADERAREVVKALPAFEARIETDGRLDALLGSFPGHGSENVRKPLINTLNLADLVPLWREWTGDPTCPCPLYPKNSPALLQATTWGGAPFYLNLHVGQLGHTLIVGQPGAGKSALLATLASQFLRYPDAQVIALDQGASLLPLTLSRADGAFYALGMEDSPALCPLAEIDTEEDAGWAEQWICMLAEQQGVALTSGQRGLVRSAIVELAAATREEAERSSHRTLTHLRPHLRDARLKSVLEYYEEGVAGRVFNGTSNAYKYARFTVFELEGLLRMDACIINPALAFVFREFEKRLGKWPSMLLLDEARRLFARKEVREYLETLRRKNCIFLMATQQLGEVARSSIADSILENCKTKILLPMPNPPETLRELYRDAIGLRDEHIRLLSEVSQQNWYLLFQEGRSRLFTLNLGPVARAFCASSSRAELDRVLELVAEHRERWPAAWLEQLGEHDAARRFEALRAERAQAPQPGLRARSYAEQRPYAGAASP